MHAARRLARRDLSSEHSLSIRRLGSMESMLSMLPRLPMLPRLSMLSMLPTQLARQLSRAALDKELMM